MVRPVQARFGAVWHGEAGRAGFGAVRLGVFGCGKARRGEAGVMAEIIETPAPVWLTRLEVASRLRVPVSTVESWAVQGRGPRFAKFGRHVRYRLADLVAWENEQFSRETS